jgi:integrase
VNGVPSVSAPTNAKATVAKAYRLLKGILETAVDDDLISRNPCRIKGAGKESAAERRIATVAQVEALADAIGIRWRLMVYLGVYGPMRPEQLAGLRRRDADSNNLVIRVRVAEPERTNGKRAPGETKSDAGVRAVVLPAFLHKNVKQHLAWFAEKGPDGLLFVGEKGAPFRRTSFGRKWRRPRAVVGPPRAASAATTLAPADTCSRPARAPPSRTRWRAQASPPKGPR